LSAFSYIPVELRDNVEEEDLTDPITRMINMGYVKETDVNPFANQQNMMKLLGMTRKKKK